MTSFSVLIAVLCSVLIGLIFPRAKKCVYCVSAILLSAAVILFGFNVSKFTDFYGFIAYVLFFAVFVLFAVGLFKISEFVAKKFR